MLSREAANSNFKVFGPRGKYAYNCTTDTVKKYEFE